MQNQQNEEIRHIFYQSKEVYIFLLNNIEQNNERHKIGIIL